MEKQILLWTQNNSVIYREMGTSLSNYYYEAMQVPETLMLQGVDQDALFELAYDAGLQEPDNVAIGATLEEALSNLADKCGLTAWDAGWEYCTSCNGIGTVGDYACMRCNGAGREVRV